MLPRALLLLDALRVRLVDQQNVSGHALVFILVFIVVYEASAVSIWLNVIASHENAIAVLHVFESPRSIAIFLALVHEQVLRTRFHALPIIRIQYVVAAVGWDALRGAVSEVEELSRALVDAGVQPLLVERAVVLHHEIKAPATVSPSDCLEAQAVAVCGS